MADMTRAQIIASGFQQSKEETQTDGLIIGLGAVVVLFVVGHFVRAGLEKRRIAKRKQEQAKRERMGAGR